jgi:hypothetical protein
MTKTITLAAMSLLLAGCAMTTQMDVNVTDYRGNPIDGATVLVDGQNIGQSPNASIRVSNQIGSLPVIRVWKDGYNPAQMEAAAEVKVPSAIGGIFLLVPFIWVYGPRANQHVVLTPRIN